MRTKLISLRYVLLTILSVFLLALIIYIVIDRQQAHKIASNETIQTLEAEQANLTDKITNLEDQLAQQDQSADPEPADSSKTKSTTTASKPAITKSATQSTTTRPASSSANQQARNPLRQNLLEEPTSPAPNAETPEEPTETPDPEDDPTPIQPNKKPVVVVEEPIDTPEPEDEVKITPQTPVRVNDPVSPDPPVVEEAPEPAFTLSKIQATFLPKNYNSLSPLQRRMLMMKHNDEYYAIPEYDYEEFKRDKQGNVITPAYAPMRGMRGIKHLHRAVLDFTGNSPAPDRVVLGKHIFNPQTLLIYDFDTANNPPRDSRTGKFIYRGRLINTDTYYVNECSIQEPNCINRRVKHRIGSHMYYLASERDYIKSQPYPTEVKTRMTNRHNLDIFNLFLQEREYVYKGNRILKVLIHPTTNLITLEEFNTAPDKKVAIQAEIDRLNSNTDIDSQLATQPYRRLLRHYDFTL